MNGRRYSNRELTDIHFVYGYCNGNAAAAVREYATRFPNRQIPTFRVFVRCHNNLLENGSFFRRGEMIRRPVRANVSKLSSRGK